MESALPSHDHDCVCPTCHQPECPSSSGGARAPAGAFPSRLKPGQKEYRGYRDWAVHPDEAQFVLHRGYAIVDGRKVRVEFIHNEAYVTQIALIPEGAAFWDPNG